MKKKKILFASSVHRFNDVRIYHKEIFSLYNHYNIDLIATKSNFKANDNLNISIKLLPNPSNFFLRIYNNIQILLVGLRRQYDGFHFHDPELIIVAFILKIFKKKIIFDIHEDNLNVIKMRKWIPSFLKPVIIKLFSRLEKFAVKSFDGIILAEDSYKKKFFQSKKIITVRNYVKLLTNPIQTNFKNKNILYVGSITIERGILDLIKSLGLLQKKNKKIGLFLIGTISKIDKSIINNEISLLPYPENVEIINYCNYDELKKYVQKSKIGVSPLKNNENYQYSIPTKILDYMNWGLPYVFSELNLSKKLFKKKSGGISYELNDTYDLFKKLSKLLNDDQLCYKLSVDGRKKIKDFEWKTESKKLTNLYKKIF